jgi:hypothetical protein
VLGEAAEAEQLLAALENLCLIPCKEYDDLKRTIAAYNQVSEFSMSALRHWTKPLARYGAAAGGSASKETKMICGSGPKVQHDDIGTAKDSNARSAQSEMR